MLNTAAILSNSGRRIVDSIKADVRKVSATGKTADSVKFVISRDGDNWSLKIVGRKFFKALETGRGPRKSTQYQEFDLNLEEYMKARGIGAGLTEKKFKQLAKFLAYKINKEGDSIFKKGGRQVYSENLANLVAELKATLAKDFKKFVISEIRNGFSDGSK